MSCQCIQAPCNCAGTAGDILSEYGGGLYLLPPSILSQDVSSSLPIWWEDELQAGVGDINDGPTSPGEVVEPMFTTEVQQLDLYRLLAIAVGIIIGVKVLSK